ncbi:Restriction enzyme BgcI subunit beta [Thermincola ferriacetica]|uniref:Restriction enzyme BgcI subunit beta n=1 Tax=Thermincola ferriacetica TaxID=281456 RepID=A0A0L6VZA2_9FIRM|nr:restriction endonuclease subunit S [Thermincola ferriacetica]KNZ68657.1 Restriction enzyme BgcI subunit beta [Thermincola ferriacetica]
MSSLSNPIDTSTWEWWKIKDLFKIERGKGIVKQNRINGNIPYISAKNNNNGLEQLICVNDKIYKNVLGWVNDGNGGVGYCFYHPYTFRPSNHITVLIPKNFQLNELTGLFFATIITLEKDKHSRGFSINNYRAENTKIKLPTTIINQERHVDFEWIENFMKNIQQKYLINHINKTGQVIADYKKSKSNLGQKIDTSHWKWFKIADLFELEKGKCGNARALLQDGNEIPYIGAKKSNNGLMRMVKRRENLVTAGNSIVFISDGQGSVGYALYQPKDFIGSTTLTIGRNPNLNVYNGLFLVSILDKERPKYSYGRKYSLEKIKETLIKLPATADGNPDWCYMENYTKGLLFSKYIS